jgi:flagellar protein FlaJ
VIEKLKFWSKNKKKAEESFDSQLLDMDFFCQLTYMSAIATSGIARSGLFDYAAKLPYISARFFRKINFVAKMFNHDYSQACRIVGEKTKEPDVKGLLLRLSGALDSGEDIANFMERESLIFSESYGNTYQRRLELLRKWSDAYVALILTTALVTVMAVVSMMIGNVTIIFILSLSALTILVTIFGAWFLYRTAPREFKTHSLDYRSREQDIAKTVVRLTLPAVGVMVVILLVMKSGLGAVMLTTGALCFPLGLISVIDDSKINKRDFEIAGLFRSLGGVSQAIGATVTEAMGRLDFRSLGALKELVNTLYTRLLAGISPKLCWNRFVCETGSEQVNRGVRIFWDGIALGGEPQRVGNEASSFATKIALLRSQRDQIASGFTWLTIAMHAVLTGLSVFIFSVFNTFSELVKTLLPEEDYSSFMSGMPSFGIFSDNSSHLNLLHFMVILIIIVLTLANAFAIFSVGGGHIYKFAFYLALTAAISGAMLLIVPGVVNMMFGVVS